VTGKNMQSYVVKNLSNLFTHLNDQSACVMWIQSKDDQRPLYVNSQYEIFLKRHAEKTSPVVDAVARISSYVEQQLGLLANSITSFNTIVEYGFQQDGSQAYLLIDENQQIIGYAGVAQLMTNAKPISNSIIVLDGDQPVEITPKEMQCLTHMMAGRSAKQTAALMKLSQRTVEFHLDNIKEKANCRTKIELLAKMHYIES
jgi:DNA-binding CsgD family transcriptional regulator